MIAAWKWQTIGVAQLAAVDVDAADLVGLEMPGLFGRLLDWQREMT